MAYRVGKILVLIQIILNLLYGNWAFGMSSPIQATRQKLMCEATASFLWSLAHSESLTSCIACKRLKLSSQVLKADAERYRLGEATDHFAQTEVEQMDLALKEAEAQNKASGDGSRNITGSGQLTDMTDMLSSIPGAGDLAQQAQHLQAQSDAQERDTSPKFGGPPSSQDGAPGSNIPGTNIDPAKTVAQIYPILEFRDKVVKIISATIEKIPGLEALVEKITETLTLFVLSLLAPFIRPIINAVSKQLKTGSGGVIDASGKHQYEPWTDPHCSDPTHSLLSKDHFSNILNEPAGQVASTILQYVAPRVIYAWQHPDIAVDQILNDVTRVFHHPALRDQQCQLHRDMFSVVERWTRSRPDGGSNLDVLLSSDSVRHGKNLTVDASQQSQTHSHGGLPSSLPSSIGSFFGSGSQSKTRDGPWEQIGKMKGFSEAQSDSSEGVTAAFQPEHDIMQPTSPSPRPPGSPGSGYSAPSGPPAQHQYGYGLSPYPPGPDQGQPQYGQPYQSQYNQQLPPSGQNPPFSYYGPQPPAYGYNYAPSYDPNTNAPPPPQPYGYGGPPPPPNPYYGGPSY